MLFSRGIFDPESRVPESVGYRMTKKKKMTNKIDEIKPTRKETGSLYKLEVLMNST